MRFGVQVRGFGFAVSRFEVFCSGFEVFGGLLSGVSRLGFTVFGGPRSWFGGFGLKGIAVVGFCL